MSDRLVWGSGGIHFSASIADPALAERTRAVLARFVVVAKHEPLATWRIEAARTNQAQWTLRRTSSPDGDEQVAVSYTGEPTVISALESGALEVLFNNPTRSFCMHAALLQRERAAILVFGPHESGKSTLACALWRAGWRLHTDDLVIVDPARAAVVAAPRRVGLRASSRALLGERLWQSLAELPSSWLHEGRLLFCPEELDAPSRVDGLGPAPGGDRWLHPTAVFFLRRREVELAGDRRSSLDPIDSVLAWLAYSNQRTPETIGRALGQLAPLAQSVPAFDLARDSLDDMISTIDEVVAD